MHAAPAVSVSCSGGLPWRLTQALLPGLAIVAVATWSLQRAELPVGWAAAPACLVFVICWHLARPRPVELRFDGAAWAVDGVVGSIEVLIDLGWAMLLRFRPLARDRSRYVGLTAGEIGSSMHVLRVALYAPGPVLPSAGR